MKAQGTSGSPCTTQVSSVTTRCKPLKIVINQKVLKAAFAREDIHGHLAWWLEFLAEYDFEIQYIKGVLNKSTDFLSRLLQGKADGHEIDEGDWVGTMMVEDDMEIIAPHLDPTLQDVAPHQAGLLLKHR